MRTNEGSTTPNAGESGSKVGQLRGNSFWNDPETIFTNLHSKQDKSARVAKNNVIESSDSRNTGGVGLGEKCLSRQV